jgi:large subunit ribosomal protein L4
LRSALAAKFADGKLIIVNAFDVKEPKTKQFREALDALKVDGSALLVDNADGNKNLELSSRNLDGIELVRGSEVHPYHLLRYDRAIFSQPAIEKLQISLKNSVSKRQREAAAPEGTKKSAPRKRSRRQAAAEVA